MDSLLKKGYTIKKEDYNELLEWGSLKNALSHFPPEEYRQIDLQENDIVEYFELLKKNYRRFK